MNLFDILKQFKTIEPDAQFTERSKREILMSPRPERRTLRGVFAFLHVIETSVAVVLAGLFILVLTGSFSGAPSIAPIQYSVIDPADLHAEAQAIDMQIQLANVDYSQATATTATVPAENAPTVAVTTMRVATVQSSTSPMVSSGTVEAASATSTPSSSISIDQALEKLSQ